MTALGDNLDFVESEYFKRRVSSVPAVAKAVTAYIKIWPSAGTGAGGSLREIEMDVLGRRFLVLFWRKMNRIGLYRIVELLLEGHLVNAALKELAKLGKGKP